MIAHDVEASPQVQARIGGVLYLIIIVLGLFGEAFARGKLIVSGDAVATARNLRSSELLWRLGIAGNLVHLVCAVALALIFYILLRPVSKDLALLATFFGLVSIVIEAASKMYLIEALFPLGKAEYLKVFKLEQLDAMAYLSIRSHGYAFGISLIFFGCACLILGYLIFRSGYLPKAIGVLMQIAGLCYLVNSFALVLAPQGRGSVVPDHPDSRLPRRVVFLRLAHGEGRQRREVETESQSGAGSRGNRRVTATALANLLTAGRRR